MNDEVGDEADSTVGKHSWRSVWYISTTPYVF